jgi:uncharacterized protein with NAD-binding domain and iron-sulfur cluster
MTERPAYIYTGGSPLQHTPMHLNASDMYGFFVKGDLAKLQASVDATLNRVAAGRMSFEALTPYVMLTFTRVGHAQSGFPADQRKGWGRETDIITWIMVGEMEGSGETRRLRRIFSYPFHVWVDVPMAISIGREIFGYPKNICRYTMPEPGGDPRQFTLASEGWQPFDPQTELATHPLLEITATDTSRTHRTLSGFFDLLSESLALLRSEPDLFTLDAAGIKDLVALLLRPRVDQIFLKQFPDASGVRAVYQAVVAAPAIVDKVHSVRLLGYDYQCNLHAFESYPLADTLGLKLGAQPVLLAFNINFDFTVVAGEELVQAAAAAPQKVAVLGGGVGAMTAAFHLTEQPNWQDRYDITVYQMGWRLGGKGASGRNAALGQRIEEHGLHIWFGFYDNAFALMQKAYAALRRPAGAPLATWEDAFKPQQFIALAENIGGTWKAWPIQTPLKPGVPGHGNEEITLWALAMTLRAWIEQWLQDLDVHLHRVDAADDAAPGGGLLDKAKQLVREAEELAAEVVGAARAAKALLEQLPRALEKNNAEHHALLLTGLRAMRSELARRAAPRLDFDDTLRRLFIYIDLAATSLAGMLSDGVLLHGFDVINDIDFRDWLRKHGANRSHTVDSAPVRGLYDLVFAYADGDFERPNIEAGTMLRGILRIAICYHGGIMWKMQAGMGDTVFTPLYEALKQRGVKFRFFHKVEDLVPDGDGVGEIVLTEQVALAAGRVDYDPLVDVAGLPCWPSAPLYAQLNADQARLLESNGVNLESDWNDWARIYAGRFGTSLPVKRLRRGADFDRIVFGLSVGSLPRVCAKLMAKSPELKAAAENVKTVATQAYQVWVGKSVAGLGWSEFGANAEQPVLSGFTEPFDTWAPMDQLLAHEHWPAGQTPKNVSYFCSALPMKDYPPPEDTGFPARCAQAVKDNALHHLQHEMFNLWPAVATAGTFDWQVLVDPGGAGGQARFDSQFWRANVDPSERYVLSVVGSTRHRPRSETSGFGNLYLAGDWLKTGLNAGCVEAAVMGGMQAARAISGHPAVIKGEQDG